MRAVTCVPTMIAVLALTGGCAVEQNHAQAATSAPASAPAAMSAVHALCGDTWLERGRTPLHADCLNSDDRPEPAPTDFGGAQIRYTLNNNMTLLNASLDFALQRAYTTTAKGNGKPNLWALQWSDHGDVTLWSSHPWDKDDWRNGGPDACAEANTPILDRAHNVYLSDCRYLWSFTQNGNVRFRRPLPGFDPTDPSATWPAASPCTTNMVFTHTGRLVCVQADAKVSVFDIGDLASSRPTTHLIVSGSIPGLGQTNAAAGGDDGGMDGIMHMLLGGVYRDDHRDEDGNLDPTLDTYFCDGDFRDRLFAAAMGSTSGPPVANAPGITRDVRAGREAVSLIFVTANIDLDDDGNNNDARMLRVDYDDATGTLDLAPAEWQGGEMRDGNGTGASATITSDGAFLYGEDVVGNTYKWRTEDGSAAWAQPLKMGIFFASPALDHTTNHLYQPAQGDGVGHTADGTVLEAGKSYLVKAGGDDGVVLAAWNYDFLANTGDFAVDPRPGYLRIAMPSTGTTINGDVLLQGFNLGYEIPFNGKSLVWPMKAILVAIDKQSGDVLGAPAPLRDSSEAYAVVDEQGTVYIGFSGLMTSMTNYWHELQLFPDLPQPLRPNGGFEIIRPAAR